MTDILLGVGMASLQLVLLGLDVNAAAAFFSPSSPLSVALILAQGLPLALRRRSPIAVFGVVLVANTMYYALAYPPTGFDFGLGFALFTVAAYRPRLTSLVASGMVLASWAALWIVDVGAYWESLRWPGFVYLVFWISAIWAWGRYVQVRRFYSDELVARAAHLERQRQLETQAAISTERVRIARELHDVLAHHMSIMVVQAGAARSVLDTNPEQARAALQAIEEAGRQGFDTMPGLIRALRDDSPGPKTAPQPTLAQLETLVSQISSAGLPVNLRIEGAARVLPPDFELSAYRIAQEALTNSLKHAGPATAELVIRYGPESFEVTVSDDGYGTQAQTGVDNVAKGHGLIGMRERVALLGGELHAGPRPEGGFLVSARLPYQQKFYPQSS